METDTPNPSLSRGDLRRASRWIVGLFWLLQFVELSLLSLTSGIAAAKASIEPRAIVLVVGVVMMLGFVEVVARLERRPFRSRLVLTIAWAMLFCVVLVTINFAVFYVLQHKQNEKIDLEEYVYVASSWSWFFLAVAGALLALSYNMEMRERERRLAALQTKASNAQLVALRYQLNPHFLFNTLNSIAALIGQKDNSTAEAMVEDLADFLRVTLELDPVADIRLEEEVALQSMYLAIEKQRYPDRLSIDFNVPSDLARARVPALIMQPLIENAIRHAVARSTQPVTLRVSARRDGQAVVLEVENDGRPSGPVPTGGTGVGIANVASRLRERFGADQSLSIGRPEAGGFKVEMRFPFSA